VTSSVPAIGHRIVRVDTVGSTNSLAAVLAGTPNSHGTIVVAREQTAGRGQYGRSWISGPDESLLLSIVLRPPAELQRPVILTAWVAVALGNVIFDLTGIHARIKWPNDLLIHGRKVCGILIEAANDTVVVGIGLNINQSRDALDRAALPQATSLAIEAKRTFELQPVLDQLQIALNREWERLVTGKHAPVESAWKARIGLLGMPVVAERYDGSAISGHLLDVSFHGVEIICDTGSVDVIPPEAIRHLRGL
jgi:BirA family biotin operon repressor/biotin-[acetyl-CoA-carboxylase] ligase